MFIYHFWYSITNRSVKRIMEDKILNDIKEMLSDGHPDVEISMETLLEYGSESCLDMTSIEIVQFILDLEEKYDIIIDIDDRYYTIGDAVRGVVGYLEEKEISDTEEKRESEV